MHRDVTAPRIPVFPPHLGVDTVRQIVDALDVGWLGMGAVTKEFEDLIAAYLNLADRRVVATNTGTSALHLGLLAAGVGPGDEVLTTSFNYVADHQAVRMTGANVVLCDIREQDLGIDCEKAETLISKRTKVILPLHFAGIPCDIEGVYRLAQEHRLRVVEDACHAFGSDSQAGRIGSFGDIICFSFDPVKVITSIDGGCVVVGDEATAERLRRLRLLGVDKDTVLRYQNDRAWDYDVVDEGYRYHLTNILASVGVSQIKRVDEFIASRQRVCRRYNDAFHGLDGVVVPQTDFVGVSPFIYTLRVLRGRREPLIGHLRTLGVDVGIHFVPVHRLSYFAGARRGDMGVTERVASQIMTLPLHSNMRPEFVDRVVEGVTSFFREPA